MADCVTEALSHDEGGDGRSVTGVHWSVIDAQNESVTGAENRNKWGQKCYGGLAY